MSRINWTNVYVVSGRCSRSAPWLGRGASPEEGLGIFVPRGEEVIDGCNKFVDAEEGITADAFVGEFGKPSLDQVQPTATGGDIVDHEAGMLPQPGFDLCSAVGPVVVHDDV